MADLSQVRPAKKAPAKPAPKKSPLELLLEAVANAEKAGVRVKGTYSYPNEDGTVNNGSLK